MRLGAGRATKDDTIDPNAGLVLHHGVGDAVEAGIRLATLYATTAERAERPRQRRRGLHDLRRCFCAHTLDL